MRVANGSAHAVCTIAILANDTSNPARRKNNAVASPMLTPGTNSGSSMSARTRRGTRKVRIAIAAPRPRMVAAAATTMPTSSEVPMAETSTGSRHSARYHRNVITPPGSAGATENRIGGTSGR